MLHSPLCRHCGGQFRPVRIGHLYCSDTCRKLAFKSKNRAKTQAKKNRRLLEKLKKLANSAFGLYLIKEIRRAGTVEILQGHTAESLVSLVSLRRRCTALGGYEDGEALSYYELSHIYPVNGKERLGLLNPANLAITSKTFNRKHGTKLPVEGYLGSSTPRASLLIQWKVADSLDSLEVLKLARKYIGEEFDIWLKKHLINLTQKGAILKKLKDAGYDHDVLKTMRLKELKAIANDEEISYFSIDKDPEDELWISRDELQRLGLDNSVLKHLNLYHEGYSSFNDFTTFKESSNEEVKFKKFLIQQAFLCIHGQPFSELWENRPFKWHIEKQVKPIETRSKNSTDDYDGDIL